MPRYDKHPCLDSVGWKDCREDHHKARLTELNTSDDDGVELDMSDEAFDDCVEFCKETEFRHDNRGSMSTCRFGGAEGTDERVLALNTHVCRVQEETREVTSVGEGHDVERVVETKW